MHGTRDFLTTALKQWMTTFNFNLFVLEVCISDCKYLMRVVCTE